MRYLLYILFFLSSTLYSQDTIKIEPDDRLIVGVAKVYYDKNGVIQVEVTHVNKEIFPMGEREVYDVVARYYFLFFQLTRPKLTFIQLRDNLIKYQEIYGINIKEE